MIKSTMCTISRCSEDITIDQIIIRYWTLSQFVQRHCLFLKSLHRIMNWILSESVIIPSLIHEVLQFLLPTSLFPRRARSVWEPLYRRHLIFVHPSQRHIITEPLMPLWKRNNRICERRVDAPKWDLANASTHTARNVQICTAHSLFFPLVWKTENQFEGWMRLEKSQRADNLIASCFLNV